MADDNISLASLLGGSSGLAGTNNTANLDLGTFQKSIAATDPWRMAQGAVSAFNPNTATWSNTERGVGSFAKNFLAGLLGGAAQNSESDQLNKVISVLPQLYKDPSSVAAPEGVDQSPFDILKGSAILKNITKQAEKDDSTEKAFAALGLQSVTNPDGSTSVKKIPGFIEAAGELAAAKDDAAAEAKVRVNAAKAAAGGGKLDRASLMLSQDLGNTIGALAALNHNDQNIAALEGSDSFIGGVQRGFESLDPNSKIAQYKKNLPFLADALGNGLTGTSGKMGIIQKTMEALSPSFGASKETLYNGADEAKQVLLDKAAKKIDALEAATGGNIPDKIKAWKEKLDAAANGTLLDDGYIPKAPPADAMAGYESLREQGKSPEEIQAAMEGKSE